MPELPQQRPIKGLNKGPGQKRFVFKSFSQRVEEVDLDVFRSLAPLKVEPSGGTSFFHESLVSWRELNSAVEFTSVYEQLLPVVQTLPQLILHKKLIINTLMSHLKLSAIHSLEPILSLIAILSRDLRSDFIFFIPQLLGACVDLFQSGGDRKPEIIEQVFTSVSYIFKYLQKPLCKDVKFILKATRQLRYYKRLYIREFTAEAVSYLLRSTTNEQLIKGIRRLLLEAHLKPSKENINSCSSLLWYTLKGPGMTLHSRADSVLRLLLDKSTFRSLRQKDPGGKVIVEVLSLVLCRLCEELDRNNFMPVWSCLLDELNSFLDEWTDQFSINKDPPRNIDALAIMDVDCRDNSCVANLEQIDSANRRGFSEEEKDADKLVIANLLALLNNLLEFRKGSQVHGTPHSRHLKFSPSVKRGLQILLKIARHICVSRDADKLLDVLLPFLDKQKKSSQEEIVDVLRVLKELAPSGSRESFQKSLPFLGQRLSSSPELDVRLAICQVLSAFSLANPALSFVAGLISDLNSLSLSSVGEYDYERRLEAYGHLTADSFGNMSYEQALLIISQGLYDVKSDDIPIRHSASNCLTTFIHFLAARYQSSITGESNYANRDRSAIDTAEGSLSPCWDLEAVKLAIQKLLLPKIRKALSSDSLVVRREWVSLLREMVLNLPHFSPLGELLPLINTDAEVDFFNNINHIQSHRRIRAMSRFKEQCCAGKFSQGTLVRIFEPLFTHSLFEAKGDKDGNLVQSAIEVIANIAAQLQWDPYYSLLMRLFHMISSHPEYKKTIIKLLCSVLDKFHFNTASISQGASVKDTFLEEAGCKSPVPSSDGLPIPEKVLRRLKLQILPEFVKLMVSKENIINVSVALAVVEVLQLMPHDVMELELPRVIQNLVNLLKNRNHIVRDEARAGLLAIVGILGAGYFGFILEKLCDSLKRGYEVHVLGFTLNALISRTLPKFKVGEIDYCAEKIFNLLGNDIFEDVADEKEVEKMAFKMKEIKRSGSHESLKLVAQKVTFHVHGSTLLQAVRRRLKDAIFSKTKGKVERVLKQLAVGIQLNPSLKQEEGFVFVHGLVEDGTADENLVAKVFLPDAKSQNGCTGKEIKESIPNYHLIQEFALQLFESHLKRAKLNKEDSSLVSMLDPMVVLLQGCLDSRHGAVLGPALKCLCHLVRLPLPSVELSGAALFGKVLVMAQGFGKFENQVAQSCFNLLVALLKHANSARVSEDQLRTILQFPVFIDLEKAETNSGLLILKAIVGRKLLVPELYDIVNRVAQLMVTSHVPVVRQYSSQIMLQFLLDYPLGSRRLQQHLDFLVTNLSYVNSTGREAVLEMLHTIIMKFPAQAVDEQLETFFLPLVTRLVNDESNQLRAMVGTILKVLMGRVSQRSLQRMLQFCFSWLREDKQQLWRAAGQVLGLAVEVMEVKYHVHLEESLILVMRILNHVLEVNVVEMKAFPTTVGSMLWQEAYYILVMLEKLLKQFPDLCLQERTEGL
ncbi:hypothetical protein L7F22_032391 [Adiantum nelumboides]|nr:hypothetical protein [Adiantum nelumboides]